MLRRWTLLLCAVFGTTQREVEVGVGGATGPLDDMYTIKTTCSCSMNELKFKCEVPVVSKGNDHTARMRDRTSGEAALLLLRLSLLLLGLLCLPLEPALKPHAHTRGRQRGAHARRGRAAAPPWL